ncbi:MAG: Ca-activated chloride channel family protein [Porticoccaceae bacterium]|jgi:Ca-activated chloride channel family protein
MTNPAFNPEDPRLTAFVLGEIDDSDRAEIEQLLESSPEAQAAVKEIEETIGVLKEGLASEPVPELTAEQRAAVEEQLAAPTVAAATEPLVKRPARFGKLAGAVASVAALGLVVTLAAPQLQPARDAMKSSLNHLASRSDGPAETVALVEFENATGFSDRVDDADYKGIVLASKLPTAHDHFEEAAGESNANGGFGQPATNPSESFDSLESAQLSVDAERVQIGLGDEESKRRAPTSTTVDPAARAVKRGRSQLAQTVPAEKPADADSVFRAKEVSRTDSPQRLIADSGSRPQGRDGQSKSGDGRERHLVLRAGRPAPGNSDSKNDSFSSSTAGLPNGFRPHPSAPASGERAADKSGLSKQLAGAVGGKAVEGARGAAPKDGNPLTRETIVRNKLLIGAEVSKPQSASGEAAADSPGPARPVALLPGQDRAKKNVLFLEESAPATGQKRKFVTRKGLAAPTEADVLRRIREREEALAPKEITETLAELSKEQQTQLAAIDSGATRRVSGRGFGLEGRDLQEQLRQHSDRLSRARTSQEKMPEAKLQAFGFGAETYEAIVENDFIVPVIGDKEKSLSTISVDVDTASYSNMRRFLSRDQLPPANSVRIEELVNYFKYDYPEPEGNEPFSVKTELASCPWQPSHRLAMIGLKAKTIDKAQRPPTNLVFLLDVSGSMRASNKLPLVQQSMRLLVEEMTEDDRVSIVTYASNAGVRLGSTLGSKKQGILAAINGLQAGGSTNGEGGIRMAYDEANRHYFQGGANRVILCSDGDFNVGKSSDDELVELIQEKAASGVFLSVFGFGMGNLKDAKLEKLADKGNGHYGYIDNLNEAKKVFQDELVGTLYTVAKDVKLQVEFNPATVGAYRLIGYENRKLAAQDFTDDTKDAGEIGSGHTVTALYEIIPKHVLLERPSVDGLKYQATAKKPADEGARETAGDAPAKEAVDSLKTQSVDQELLTVKLRYKKPDEEVSEAVENDYAVLDVEIAGKQLSAISDDLMFAASVASFGMNLRGSKYRGNWGFAEALETAQGAQGEGNNAQRTEFIQLVQRAMRITGQQGGPQPSTGQGTTTRPGELDATAARLKASTDGKYRRLVKKIEVRDDFQRFGAFNDFGHWDGTEYAGHKDLPPGNWVYVYPNWYIWAEAIVPPTEAAAPKAEPTAPKPEDKPAEEEPAVK